MDLLNLTPSRSRYSLREGSPNLTTRLKGGLSRSRRDLVDMSYSATVSWRVGPQAYAALCDFYETHRGVTFLLDLIVDQPELTRHQVNFEPGTFRLESVSGSAYVVSATLEVRPLAVDESVDEAVMDLFEIYGAETGALLALLEQLVNVDLPEALE